ncbi:MAG: fused MFS/spermidine synthase [Candidatus Yanofskybacteria bacterium]|nr:fused MFS/spermidine synthase [Candidatus Yanofskybacteria bacterium]
MKKYLLEIIVFIAGMSIMVFELVGSRILAPYVGTTIMVWSALIGVILAFLSAGYWWGGRIADRKADYKYFCGIIFMAGVSVGLTALIKIPVINFLDQYFRSFQWEAVWISIVLFGPASFFLAAVSPYAVRLRLSSVKESGEIVGGLYAISTIGSIVGTFLTGMVLVPLVGNTKILFALAAVLLFASVLAYRQSWLKARVAVLALVLILPFFSSRIDYYFIPLNFVNSAYMDIAVAEDIYSYVDPETGATVSRQVIEMYTSPTAIQSAIFADGSDELVLEYSKLFRVLPKFFHPNVEKALLIGGAGYTAAKDFLNQNTEGTIDVVEIDPKMTEIAKKYFNLEEGPRLGIYHEDGRTYLNKNKKKYDLVMVDAFHAFIAPYQLTTLEAVQKIHNSLNDDGIAMINIYQSINGDGGKFFRAEYATFKEIFPQLYVFRVQSPDLDTVQNLILIATKSSERRDMLSDNEEVAQYLQRAWDGEVDDDMPILTDDFAPTEHYMASAREMTK